jgi:ABC-type sugar transport system permease subunit
MAIAIGTSETAQGSIERSGRANLDRMLPYGLIAPAVFVAFATAVVPMGYAIWLSLQD